MPPRTALAALACLLLAGLPVAQDRQFELRDSLGRLLRGIPLTAIGSDGRQHDLRTSLDGRLVVSGSLRARTLRSAEFPGVSLELDPDTRAQLPNEIDQRRIGGMRSPSNADSVIARVRDRLNDVSLEALGSEWNALRGRLNRAGITQDRFDAVTRAIADIMAARDHALATLGEPEVVPAAEVLARLDDVEAVLTDWRSLRDTLGEVTGLALLQPGSDEARRTRLLMDRFLGNGASSIETGMRDLACATDTPITNLAILGADSPLDGLGFGKLEFQIRLESWVAGESGEPPVRSGAPAPEPGTRIGFRRENCRTEPDEVVIPAGSSGASVSVLTDATGGTARVVASAAGLADVEILMDIVLPWRTLAALIAGLATGVYLRTRLFRGGTGTDATRDSPVVDSLAALALLGAWFAGYVAFVAPYAPAIDPRAGTWTQFLTGATCALVGLPPLSGWVKRWVRRS